MMRFAIVRHDHPFLHWDLLLEMSEACWTWRLLESPESSQPILAERLPNHRLIYLTYAGPVSGNRGEVTPWDHGELIWLTARHDFVRGLLHGARCCGVFQIQLDGNQILVTLPVESESHAKTTSADKSKGEYRVPPEFSARDDSAPPRLRVE